MHYDADKTPRILEELRESVASRQYKAAIQLLRHAEAGGRLRGDPGVLGRLRDAVGHRHAARIVAALADDPCKYCNRGREQCGDCNGRGYLQGGKVCLECSGLGVVRCPFCNGTALAGYDFVPRGLRPPVVARRLTLAERQLSKVARGAIADSASAADLASRIIDIDRCRGVLANAVEQARLHSVRVPGARPAFSPAQRAAIEERSRNANARAEAVLRRYLAALARSYAEKAQRAERGDERRALYAHRAKTFGRLSGAARFENSVLETPQSLRPGSA